MTDMFGELEAWPPITVSDLVPDDDDDNEQGYHTCSNIVSFFKAELRFNLFVLKAEIKTHAIFLQNTQQLLNSFDYTCHTCNP